MTDAIIDWLLQGDVSVQYQVHRDLLAGDRPDLQDQIAREGWGAQFLEKRKADGHWGEGFYHPKWKSSHYTLLDLKHLQTPQNIYAIQETITIIFTEEKEVDGGLNPAKTMQNSDVCINGMALNYASFYRTNSELLKSVIDYILSQQMRDGGFNCQFNRKGAVHSSLHSTISVLEGIREYLNNGYTYRADELQVVECQGQEFILQHKLYKSHRTGEIIRKQMTMLSFPSRWYFDILRGLEYFRNAGLAYDTRMQDAIDLLLSKRRKDGRWPLQAKHPGEVHFEMEKPGAPSRWNTLRALRVLNHFNIRT